MLIVLAVWLGECAWLYLVVRAVSGASNAGLAFTPMLLAPYGAALIVSLLLSPLYQGTRFKLGLALVATLVNLLGAAASIAAVTWWELYRDRPLLDPSWLVAAREDTTRYATSLPPILWPILLGVFLWWRGARLAREEIAFPGLVSRFTWGTLALLVLAVAGWLSAWNSPMATVTIAVYLLAAMAAMAAARLEMAQAERAGAIDRRWQGSSIAVALILVVGGAALSIALAPWLGEAAAQARNWFLSFLLPLLMDLLRWIAHLLGLDTPPKPMATPPPGPGAAGANTDNPFTLPESIRGALRLMFNVSWIVIILVAVYRWVESWTWGRRPRAKSGYGRERLPWSPIRSLRGFLVRLFELLLRWIPALATWTQRLVAPADRTSTVRELYGRLLGWGAKKGQERVPWATPREYVDLLASRWPALEAEFRTITDSYERARYGTAAIQNVELQEVMAAWATVAAARHTR